MMISKLTLIQHRYQLLLTNSHEMKYKKKTGNTITHKFQCLHHLILTEF